MSFLERSIESSVIGWYVASIFNKVEGYFCIKLMLISCNFTAKYIDIQINLLKNSKLNDLLS
jgi:hypothetical protein